MVVVRPGSYSKSKQHRPRRSRYSSDPMFAFVVCILLDFSTAAELVVSKTGIANAFDGIGELVIADIVFLLNVMYDFFSFFFGQPRRA